MSEENEKKSEDSMGKDAAEALFKSRSVFIYGEVTQEMAQKVSAQLLAMAATSDEDIKVFINSPGGHVESGDCMHDIIKFIKPKVWIIGTGWVASAGALVYISAPSSVAFACQTPASCCTNHPAVHAAWPLISKFRPAKSSK